jgi:hypothetical protein
MHFVQKLLLLNATSKTQGLVKLAEISIQTQTRTSILLTFMELVHLWISQRKTCFILIVPST